jgi:HlyD family secretion protein
MKRGKILLICLLAAGVLGGGYWSMARPGSAPPGEPGILQTDRVNRGDLEILVSSTGTLAAVGTVDVGTQVSGTIDKVFVDFNDTVTQGQVLAVLDPSLFEAAVSEAQAGLIKARATFKQAQAEVERNRSLYENGHLSAQEFLDLETSYELARAEVLSAEASLKQAKTNLKNTQIKSPINGTVITRSIEAGQTVAASYSTPTLFLIAEDLKRMQIEASVDESDIGQIRVNQPVRFTVQSYPDREFTGNVSQIRLDPTTVSNVVTYTVMVDAANEEGILLPGMTATLDFIVAQVTNRLLIPNAALRFRPDGKPVGKDASTVYVMNPGRPLKKVVVHPGISDGVWTAIDDSDDLKEGMVLVTGRKTVQAAQKSGLLSRLFPGPSRHGGRP